MKIIFTIFLLFPVLISKAQWSNTTNEFYDSLAMPVCSSAGNQFYPIVLKSYPDSGYFIIWEDGINDSQLKLFAQKYDKLGNRLWSENGIQIATSTFPLYYRTTTNYRGEDWRNYSFAATDSANGFYIIYDEADNSATYTVMAQHIKEDGTGVFANDGYPIYKQGSGPSAGFTYPQLIADGNKGFFAGFIADGILYVGCYRDDNGLMKYYGGGAVSYNAEEYKVDCGRHLVGIVHPSSVADYLLYSNLQKGCEVLMNLYIGPDKNSLGGRYYLTAFNELARVKNELNVPVTFPENKVIHYPKDSVMVMYQVRSHSETMTCEGGTGIVTTYIQISNGFLPISENHSNQNFVRGTILPTDGNINIEVAAALDQDAAPKVKAYYRPKEKYDDIPYGYKTAPYFIPQGGGAPNQDKINYTSDTILFTKTKIYDFALKSSGNKIFATALADSTNYTTPNIFLQELKVERMSADSFAVNINTKSKYGIEILNGAISGNPVTQIYLNPPQLAVDEIGNAVFYANETGHYIRVSPITDGAVLAWGPGGRATGNPYYDNSGLTVPYICMSPRDGTAVLAWYGYGNSSKYPRDDDIFMRHLDSLNVADYVPPKGKVKLLPSSFHYSAYPNSFYGLSGKWSDLNYTNNNPLAGLLDINYLGTVKVSVYQKLADVRLYKGLPYLNRNYTIIPQFNPTAPQPVRLYFTNEDMDALKAADPTITGPEMLQVVKQPSVSQDAPATFTPSSEETINPASWGTVNGGYYLEFNVNSFSNFYIQKINGPMPVTWLDIHAQWKDENHAIIVWKVTNQLNTKKYTVQESKDGADFTNACEVAADNSDTYSCIIPADPGIMHYYRVLQSDAGGNKNFSKVIKLSSRGKGSVYLFPNPATSSITITGLHNFSEYHISDINGRIVVKDKIKRTNEIPVSSLQPGIYILKLIGGENTKTLKFIKK